MRRFSVTILLAALLVAAPATAQVAGEMVFEQGCDAFFLVEDLGTSYTGRGEKGRWLLEKVEDGAQLVLARETLDLVSRPFEDPLKFGGTTIAAWEFEGTDIQGTNRTSIAGEFEPASDEFSGFFEGEVIRGNHYTTGGLSGSFSGEGPEIHYDAATLVLCLADPWSVTPRPGW